jgi:hypothetical protein
MLPDASISQAGVSKNPVRGSAGHRGTHALRPATARGGHAAAAARHTSGAGQLVRFEIRHCPQYLLLCPQQGPGATSSSFEGMFKYKSDWLHSSSVKVAMVFVPLGIMSTIKFSCLSSFWNKQKFSMNLWNKQQELSEFME